MTGYYGCLFYCPYYSFYPIEQFSNRLILDLI